MSDQPQVVPNPADLKPSVSRLSINALVSTITGALSYLLIFLHSLINMGFIWAAILAPISAIVAIVTGHKGKHEIRKSEGQMSGTKLAKAGLIMGYIYIGICVLLLFLVIVGAAGIAQYIKGLL